MCGITGVIEYAANECAVSNNILKKMSDEIAHRGPDSDGQWTSSDKMCGFAFRRLAIIDLSPAGNQPMLSPDEKYCIVFNGEIYNHNEIRQELTALGYKYKSGTDTETILYGYMQWGEQIVNKLTGMWSFAIWDCDKKELFASRDRIGIKPFYFSNMNGRFIFGSEIKSILAHPASHKEINFEELPNYLNYGLTSQNATLFAGVNKIPAGHFIKLDSQGNFQLKRYWSPINSANQYTDLKDTQLQEKTLDLLRTSVKARMMSDVPFGVFLSGGIDSSANVALMAELMNRPVDTFTVGFKSLEKYNELEYARKIARLFETKHREVLIDENDALEVMDSLAWHEDEPNADPVCIPLYFLSKLTRDSGTIVVQVGEGSDEQFAGYPWIMRDYRVHEKYWKKYAALPSIVRKTAYSLCKPILKSTGQELALDLIRRSAYNEEYYWSGVSIIPPVHLETLFNDKYKELSSIPAKYAAQLHKNALNDNPKADYYQRMLYLELQQRLAEILLMRVDKITMAHSIEARVPFLDHRMVEFTMSIPPNEKMPDNKTTKYILKKATESILPDEIINRRKQGFAAPVSEWLADSWKNYAKNEIGNSFFVKEKIFDVNEINKMIEAHSDGKKNYSRQIFALLMLSLWHKRFFN